MNSVSFNYAVQHLIGSTDTSLFALVDGLQYERFSGTELILKQSIATPLFEQYPDSRIAFASPWMIRMNGMMNIRESLTSLELALPSVSWIVSTSTLVELVTHFQQNMNIVLPDGRVALLRFQDPRVQVRLSAMLDEQQHRELTCLTREWITTVEGKSWSLKQREFIC